MLYGKHRCRIHGVNMDNRCIINGWILGTTDFALPINSPLQFEFSRASNKCIVASGGGKGGGECGRIIEKGLGKETSTIPLDTQGQRGMVIEQEIPTA